MKKFLNDFKQRTTWNKIALIFVGLALIVNIISVIATIALQDWGGILITVLNALTTALVLATIYISEG